MQHINCVMYVQVSAIQQDDDKLHGTCSIS